MGEREGEGAREAIVEEEKIEKEVFLAEKRLE